MKISELPVGHKCYTQLGADVLAVLSRRVEGYCVYVGAVRGDNHEEEYMGVVARGTKQNPKVAEAIVTSLFYPGFEVDVPYAA